MKRCLPVALLGLMLGTLLLGCRSREETGETITVFAAASLSEAFTELGGQFRQTNSGSTITFNFSGSQELAQQLAQGAPADVFASADGRQMERAVDAGRIDAGTVQIFAHNRLTVILPPDNPGQVDSLQTLARPGVQIVMAAEAVPAGQYSRQYLRQAGAQFGPEYERAVMDNVVSFEQNVRGVLTKVALGEADAGIVYTSDVHAHNANNESEPLLTLEIPADYNVSASYPIALVADSTHPSLAQAFIELVHSPAGQAILAEHGFIATTSE